MTSRPTARRHAPAGTRRALFLSTLLATQVAQSASYEERLVAIAEQIGQGQVSQALISARALVDQYPGSRVGRLMVADLLAAQAGGLATIGAGNEGRGLDDLRQELSARWQRVNGELAEVDQRLPDALLKVSAHSAYVVFADLARSRLFLYANDNGRLRRVHDFYVTQGLNGSGKEVEGDQRTPVGVYYVTGYIDGSTLPSRYGPGALPITYPNAMDRRYQRTGYGIWIHGTEPYLLNRAPRASDGCLSLNNDDFLLLNQTLAEPQHTPVIIDESPNWVDRASLQQRRERLLLAIEAWRRDRSSGDGEALFRHYDQTRFFDGRMDFAGWSAAQQAGQGLAASDIVIDDVELFGYPGEKDVVLADFQQQVRTASGQRTLRTQQYWKLGSDGSWRIIFEGASQKAPEKVMVEEESRATPPPSS